ncbi:MAG: DNA translocase FtsK 4TM domain-containing protein, partial [Novosphingobium sp.]
MASRALAASRQSEREWRVTLRRSLRRAAEMTVAAGLVALMLFLALALVSYHQTDPSASTAAGERVANWMGPGGAWSADWLLFAFGPPAGLWLPLLYLQARRLWQPDLSADSAAPAWRWGSSVARLLVALVLLGTVLALVFASLGASLPASMGGIVGLLGASGVRALAELAPAEFQGWAILGLALLACAGGALLLAQVFARDWKALLPRPRLPKLPARRAPAAVLDAGELPAPRPLRRKAAVAPAPLPDPAAPPRKSPEITDPRRPPEMAQLSSRGRQGDFFDKYELPSLDLLAEPPPVGAVKHDKLALEQNARLLEGVLEDFNVKGEITAVRTGPVVTMYELEPAPGIKASRVIGLAEDIARNMSAISA